MEGDPRDTWSSKGMPASTMVAAAGFVAKCCKNGELAEKKPDRPDSSSAGRIKTIIFKVGHRIMKNQWIGREKGKKGNKKYRKLGRDLVLFVFQVEASWSVAVGRRRVLCALPTEGAEQCNW